MKTSEIFTQLDEANNRLIQLISSFNEEQINTIPFKDSWTAAQVAVHITKSNKSIIQALNMEGKPAERNPEERVKELKDIFLDFNTKLKSPDFIVPRPGAYDKDTVISDLQKSMTQLKEESRHADLTEFINIPALGGITKAELLHFVLYHTQRHTHQLKNISQSVLQNIILN